MWAAGAAQARTKLERQYFTICAANTPESLAAMEVHIVPRHAEVLYPNRETKFTTKRIVVECGVSDSRDIGESCWMAHPELHRPGVVNKRPGSHSQHRTVEIGTRLYDTAHSRTKPSIRPLRSRELQKCNCAHNTIKSHVARSAACLGCMPLPISWTYAERA